MTKKILISLKETIFIGIILSIAYHTTFSQSNEPLPPDSSVIHGQLANGLTYYMRCNKKPENRAVLMLANKVGSIMEDEHERGLAHFTEHMAFKGTKHFPGNSLVEYLQEKGICYGADLNAYTGFDQTVYYFPIQTNDSDLMNKGFQILRDWAGDLLMEANAIDSERGVILEEKRQRQNLQQRVLERTFPIMTRGSKYAMRMPIGVEEIIANLDHEVIRSFYKKWYRPDLQAVIVISDFDVAEVKALIEEVFGNLQVPEKAPVREKHLVQLDHSNEYLKYTEDEIALTSVEIMHKHESKSIEIEKDFFNSLIHQRLSDLAKQADPPFQSASLQIGSASGEINSATIRCVTTPGKLEIGLSALYRELHRVQIHGFTETEIERVKNSILQNQQQAFETRHEVPSESYANVYLGNFLSDTPYPESEYVYKFHQTYLPKVSAAEIQAHVEKFFSETNRDIFVLGPSKHEGDLPNEEEIVQLIQDVVAQPVEAFVDVDLSAPLLPEMPRPGTIVEENVDERIGLTYLTLSNGVKVVLKPTDFHQDGIQIGAFSKGCSALYDENEYDIAINAMGVVSRSGLGTYGAIALPKKLAGTSVSVTPYLNDAVVEMIKEELIRLAEEGPTEAEIQKVIAESLVGLENAVKQDSYWHGRIMSQLQHDEDPALILRNEEIIRSLSVDKMKTFLREHIKLERLKEFILLPETTEE